VTSAKQPLCLQQTIRVTLYEAARILLVRATKWSWLKAWAMLIARRLARLPKVSAMKECVR
jgi:transposase